MAKNYGENTLWFQKFLDDSLWGAGYSAGKDYIDDKDEDAE